MKAHVILKFLAAIACCGAIAAIALVLRRKKDSKSGPSEAQSEVCAETTSVKVRHANRSEVSGQLPLIPTLSTAPNASSFKDFDGLYAALARVANKLDPTDAAVALLAEWDETTRRTHDALLIEPWKQLILRELGADTINDESKLALETMSRIASQWIAQLEAWGVVPDAETEFSNTDHRIRLAYDIPQNEKAVGDFQVTRPAWRVKKTRMIVERGSLARRG